MRSKEPSKQPSAAPSPWWQLNPEIVEPEVVRLNPHLLDRFIVIPEYRLLFCYMEKVPVGPGGTSGGRAVDEAKCHADLG